MGLFDLLGCLLGSLKGEVQGSKLRFGQICELSEAHFPGVGGVGVVLMNSDVVPEEDSFSILLLPQPEVHLSKLLLEVCEGVFAGGLLLILPDCQEGEGRYDGRENQGFVHQMIIYLLRLVNNFMPEAFV